MSFINDPLKFRPYGLKNPQNLSKLNHNEGSKRYYPVDYKGNIDEWLALEIQKKTAIDNLKNQNLEDKKKRTKALLDEKNAIQQIIDLENEYETMQKIVEGNMIKAQTQEFKQAMNEILEKKNALKESMADSYLSHMHNAKQSILDRKIQELEEEKQRMEIIQKLIAKEKEDRNAQKAIFKEDTYKMLKVKELQKEYEKSRKKIDDQEAQKMNAERALKEIEKEMKYKQFFTDYDQNLTERQKMHMDSVTNPQLQKNEAMNEWINKSVENQKEIEKQESEMRKTKRKLALQDLNNSNIDKIKKNEQDKFEFKSNYLNRAQENARLIEVNNKYQKEIKNERWNEQNAYHSVLSTQQKIKNDFFGGYGTMTNQEKKLNKADLHHYKESDGKIDSMIPGLFHTYNVGSKPTCRIGKIVANSLEAYKNFSPIVNKSLKDISKLKELSDEKSSQNTKYSRNLNIHDIHNIHNPITNPLSHYNQNPYIQKQMNNAFTLKRSLYYKTEEDIKDPNIISREEKRDASNEIDNQN